MKLSEDQLIQIIKERLLQFNPETNLEAQAREIIRFIKENYEPTSTSR